MTDDIVSTALRAAAIFVVMLVVIRLLGKRTVGNFSAFDLLVALMLVGVAGLGMLSALRDTDAIGRRWMEHEARVAAASDLMTRLVLLERPQLDRRQNATTPALLLSPASSLLCRLFSTAHYCIRTAWVAVPVRPALSVTVNVTL